MTVVLDEGAPRGLAKALATIGIAADPFDRAWEGLANGALLKQAEAAGYTVLVTNDKNMAFQQNLEGRPLAIVALPSNRRRIVMARVDDITDTIRRAEPGLHVTMNFDGTRVSRRFVDGLVIADDLPPVRTFRD